MESKLVDVSQPSNRTQPFFGTLPGVTVATGGTSAGVCQRGMGGEPARGTQRDRRETMDDRTNALAWTAVALLLIVQYALFARTIAREISWFTPFNFDQAFYLNQSYSVYNTMSERGWLNGAIEGLSAPLPTGALAHVAAPTAFYWFGPSRLAALSLSFVLFGVFQICLVGTLAWACRRWSVAFFALGLLLAAATPFTDVGGLFDFRLDFGAFCLFGVFVCLVVRSGVFASARWSAAAGLGALVLTLYRHLTTIHMVGILGVCFVVFCARWIASRSPAARQLARQRALGVVLAAATFSIPLLPVLYVKRDVLWEYYVVASQLGKEKDVRAAEQGLISRWDHAVFYGKNVLTTHTDSRFLLLAACGGIAAAALRLGTRRGTDAAAESSLTIKPVLLFLSAALIVPYSIMAYTTSKSPVIGNILVVPLLGFALLPVAALAKWRPPGTSRVVAATLLLLSAAGLATGAHYQQGMQRQHNVWTLQRSHANELLAVYADIAGRSAAAGWKEPHFFCDCIQDVFLGPAITAFTFEQTGRWLPVNHPTGGNVMIDDEAVVMGEVQISDFILLSATGKAGPPCYPFQQCVAKLRPQIQTYCERELILLRTFDHAGETWRLFARPLAGERIDCAAPVSK